MNTQNEKQKSFGITGSTFKIIAIATMFIDHIGAVIVERYMRMNMSGSGFGRAYEIDMVLRYIGRLGFPMFCFLLVEGFLHTGNRMKYAMRLFAFCLISEIPFNLAVTGQMFNSSYQNVFFTLFIGFIVMLGIEEMEKKVTGSWVLFIGEIVIAVIGALAAEYLMTDYGACGIITIFTMYILRQNKMQRMCMGCVILVTENFMEITSFLALIPVKLYNGRKGLPLKYVFYWFYPVHLLVLYGISVLMGLA